MNMRLLGILAVPVILCSAARAAESPWPSRPIRVVVPFVAGGGVDSVARIATQRLGTALGQQVIVDNRPGGRAVIGTETVARAAPDAYTLLVVSESLTVMPFIERNLQFDVRGSFAPVSLLATGPLILAVHPSVAQSMKEFIALARAKPGAIIYGSSGPGPHLASEYMKKMGGFTMTHIPYKGGAQAIVDLAGGQLQAVVMGSAPAIPLARSGKVRILTVMSKARTGTLPNVPTLAESGIAGVDLFQWIYMLAPAKTPPERIARLNAELGKVLALPDVKEKFEAAGFEVAPSTPQQLDVMIREALDRWGKLVPELGLKIE
jgi:tripartite-type tricarboxylate transporter receptor subunit TctC